MALRHLANSPQQIKDAIVAAGCIQKMTALLYSDQFQETCLAHCTFLSVLALTQNAIASAVLQKVIAALTSHQADFRLLAAIALHHLALSSNQNWDALVTAGALPALVTPMQADCWITQHRIASILRHLAVNSVQHADAIIAAGFLPLLVIWARSSACKLQRAAALVFRCLASSITLGTEAAAVTLQGIAALLPSDVHEVVGPATVTVLILAEGSSSGNSQIFFSGVMPLLVQGLTSSNSSIQAVTVAALHQLAVNSQQGRDEVIEAGSLPLLLSMLKLYMPGVAEPRRFRWAVQCLEVLAAGFQHNMDAIFAAGFVPVLAAVVRNIEGEGDYITRYAAATALGRLMKGSQRAKDAIICEKIVHKLVGRWALARVASHAEAAEVLACLASIPGQAQRALLKAEAHLTGRLNSDDPELRAKASQALATLGWAITGYHAWLA